MVAPLPGYPPVQMLPVSVARPHLDACRSDPPAARELLRAEGHRESGIVAHCRGPSQKQRNRGDRAKAMARTSGYPSQSEFPGGDGLGTDALSRSSTHKSSRIPGPCSSTIPTTFWCRSVRPYLHMDGPGIRSGVQPRERNHRSRCQRMNALAACEAQLMKAMPTVPIFHDTWAYLEAPYLRGPEAESVRMRRGSIRLDRHELEAAVIPRISRRTLFAASPFELGVVRERRRLLLQRHRLVGPALRRLVQSAETVRARLRSAPARIGSVQVCLG